MIRIKSLTDHRPYVLLVIGFIGCWLAFSGTGFAQNVRTDARTTIPVGTMISVRTTDRIDTNSSDGQVFHGVVDQDVFGRDGERVIPRGSDAELIVRRISDNELALDLDSVVVHGERYGIEATGGAVRGGEKQGIGANPRTGEYLGGGAILGAIIGGIAGGGKGAAIGAGAGAAVGAGAEMMTRGNHISVPAESLLTFRLTEPMQAGISDDGYTRDGHHYHQGYGHDAYEQGLRDGREAAEHNMPQNADVRRFHEDRDRQDYEAGYNEGYQNFMDHADYGRQKPGYSGSPWSISIGPNKNVTWQAPDNAKIYVQMDDQPPKLFASGQSGVQGAPWMTPGHRYVFILQDQNGNEVARTEEDLR